jgi:hypothetical protein
MQKRISKGRCCMKGMGKVCPDVKIFEKQDKTELLNLIND